jgi:hypothetical protein
MTATDKNPWNFDALDLILQLFPDAACGLDWEEACGNFRESNRTICTMSTMQVRRPLGKASGRAKSYSAHLQPLVESLQVAGVDLVTGALIPEQDRVSAASAQR